MPATKLLLSFLSLLLASTLLAKDRGLSRAERALAVGELAGSSARLLALVGDLSEAQLHFRPGEKSWTIAECIEHLILTEQSFGQMVEEMIAGPADTGLPGKLARTDEEILMNVSNRTRKFQTAGPFEPTGRWESAEDMLAAISSHRRERIHFVKTTAVNLRHHGTEFPFGRADAFQALLTLASHCQRHIQQIEEIMAAPGFPRG